MRLATLSTIRQSCCLPLHMTVRLTPAVDSVQVWTCYNCYAIVETVWSEVVFVRCVTEMDRRKFEQSCAIKCCVKIGKSATVTYEKSNRRSFFFFWHSGDRPQGICATRTNCQSNFLSGSPWKTQEKGATSATRHCTHLDAAPRQRPM